MYLLASHLEITMAGMLELRKEGWGVGVYMWEITEISTRRPSRRRVVVKVSHLADTAQIIAQQVHNHEILCLILLRVGQR